MTHSLHPQHPGIGFRLRPLLEQFLLIILLSGLPFAATLATTGLDAGFLEAEKLYESGEYEKALPLFEEAVERSPGNSHYQHMLGKCYGRLAEHGSWLGALRYVNKTLFQFKKAVELDETNKQALRDLEEFYRRAPVFLGGSRKKAGEIRQRLEQLEQDRADTSSTADP